MKQEIPSVVLTQINKFYAVYLIFFITWRIVFPAALDFPKPK